MTGTTPDIHTDTHAPRANPDRSELRRRAQNHFTDADARTALVKEQLENERAVFDAKTAKLRELRLAKEKADAEAAINAPKPAKKPRRRATTRRRII